MKRAVLIAAAIALMVPAGANAAARTKVKFDGYAPLLNAGFYGRVESPRKRCKDDRKVIVYYKDANPDARIGADRAELGMDSAYSWFVEDSKPLAGAYYAKAKPIDGCEGDKSKVFEL